MQWSKLGSLTSQTYEEQCNEVGSETLVRRCYVKDMAKTFKVDEGVDREKYFSKRGMEKKTRQAKKG
jgi:hypothetical protein